MLLFFPAAAVVDYGFTNTSLKVYRDIKIATPCNPYTAGIDCISPPLTNPLNGARVMECSSWYTNTSSVMVSCPTQPYCCDDTQCFTNDYIATTDFCWASQYVCIQEWGQKHKPSHCDNDWSNYYQQPSTIFTSTYSECAAGQVLSGPGSKQNSSVYVAHLVSLLT